MLRTAPVTLGAPENLSSGPGSEANPRVGLHSRADVDRLMVGLFADRPDQVGQMDSQINRIPGLTDLDLIRRTLETAAA